ncbi:hypothetical protein Taro_036612 [Colocasia esculenta]|uniref:Uncharacterized protein n=1 Tax=Colocasia esculenta TaxID=4460 RepID=A0A843WIC5_COLES|nr:hypothetical protein [Colocasia esculenta]
MDYDTYFVVAAPLRWILIFSETSDAALIPRTKAGLQYLSRSCSSLKMDSYILGDLERDVATFHDLRLDYSTYPATPDAATFHDLRLDYGTYPAVAAPETSNVVNVPQKEAALRPQTWEMFHRLRMDYDTYSVVAAPLRFVCLVSLETPDVGDVPQTENRLRHLSSSCYSFEINFILNP